MAKKSIDNKNLQKLIEKSDMTAETKKRLIDNVHKLTEMEKVEIVLNLRMQEMLAFQDEFEKKTAGMSEEEKQKEQGKFDIDVLEKYQKRGEEGRIQEILADIKNSRVQVED